ncbi:MAG: alpha/beta hydrolase [Steroidobacteraceae bacterium]|nr:alpha/beta hydrolase [Steroidobacteraceae bacterium]
MPVVDANALKIDCEVSGEPGAPAVLLIMGLGMPSALWPDPVVQTLTGAGFRVVTFDNRDSGGSSRLEGVPVPNVLRAIGRALLRRPVAAPYTLDDMAADTVGLLDALGLDRVHVVGASMGGMIGQVLAAKYPSRVLSLTSIMSNSGNPDRKLAFGRWKALRAIIRKPPSPDDHEAVVRHLMYVFGVIGSPAFRHELESMRPLFERVARRGLYRAGTSRQLLAILATGDRRPLLQQITAPTLVLHGADDPLVPVAAGQDTAAHIPGAQLEVIPGMGHDFPPGLMAQLAARIAEHCKAAQPAATAPQPAPPLDPPAGSPDSAAVA